MSILTSLWLATIHTRMTQQQKVYLGVVGKRNLETTRNLRVDEYFKFEVNTVDNSRSPFVVWQQILVST